MIKTYITTLLVVLFAVAQSVRAQESMDDVFAQMDEAGGESAPEVAVEPEAAVESAETADVDSIAAPESAPVADGDLLERGLAYYNAGDYDNAEAIFGAMLAIDPYNTDAMKHLKRTANRIKSLEERKRVTTRSQSIKEIETKWNDEPRVLIAIEDPKKEKEEDPDALAIQQMEDRIKAIMIPSLEFRDEASAKDVILFLSETCRRLDPEGKGVNMIPLGMDPSFDAEGNSIMLSIRDVSLYEALSYVSKMAKLTFKIKPNAIEIMPVAYVEAGTLVTKSFTVSNGVGEHLMSAAGSDDGGGEADDLFGDSFSSEPAGGSGPQDVASFFSTVDFPDGAEAEYHSGPKKLYVKNTEENVKAIALFLNEMEDQASRERSQQVEIETKFVEFNEGALEELGFDWTMYGSGTVGGFGMKDGTYFNKTSGYVVPRTPRDPAGADDPYREATLPTPIYTDARSGYAEIPQTPKPGQNVLGSAQRNNTTAFGVVQSGLIAAMGGSPAAMVFGNGDLDLRITAMEQEGSADILSAPKITTKSGNEAIIRVVEVHRYPQDWDVETGQKTAPVIKPQDWEDFDLGIVLKVTPMVNAESNTIDLDLQPEITKFRGFDEYKVGSNAYDVSGNTSTTLAIVGDNAPLIVKMPFFELRSIQTQVTLADGNTIMMGGLVSERTETFRDQVPFLGDIPYLGRLFRTEGSRTQKRNLTILVKAQQVDDRGMSQDDRDTVREATASN